MTLAGAFGSVTSMPDLIAFPALEEILLDIPCEVFIDDYVEMFRNLPPIHTLTLCETSLPLIARAMDILHGNGSLYGIEDDIIPESFWTGYPSAQTPGTTTYKQDLILGLQDYIPTVTVADTSCHLVSGIWPTPSSLWSASEASSTSGFPR
jgi:hypothetical protein